MSIFHRAIVTAERPALESEQLLENKDEMRGGCRKENC